jgi:hypothetical protein
MGFLVMGLADTSDVEMDDIILITQRATANSDWIIHFNVCPT